MTEFRPGMNDPALHAEVVGMRSDLNRLLDGRKLGREIGGQLAIAGRGSL